MSTKSRRTREGPHSPHCKRLHPRPSEEPRSEDLRWKKHRDHSIRASDPHRRIRRFEGRPDDRFEGRPDDRFEGRPDDRLEGRPAARFEGRPGDRYEGRPGDRYEGRPDDRFEGRAGDRFEGRSAARYEGRSAARYEGRPGDRYEGRPGSRYEGPPGNRYEGPPGQENRKSEDIHSNDSRRGCPEETRYRRLRDEDGGREKVNSQYRSRVHDRSCNEDHRREGSRVGESGKTRVPEPGEGASESEDDPNDLRAQRRRELQLLRMIAEEEEKGLVSAAAELAEQLRAHRAQHQTKHHTKELHEEDLPPSPPVPKFESEYEEDRMSISDDERPESRRKPAKAESSEPQEEEDTETKLMQQMLGFCSFSSSKGKLHVEADLSGVARKTKRKYRQYMNRKGGFNRPLSPVF